MGVTTDSNEKGRIVAIIQARMGSTRRPRKMVEALAGHPLIHHILERAHAIAAVDEVVLATTESAEDDILAHFAEKAGAVVYRGSEHNVLERFIDAADAARADYLIRLCGDAPLFDPVAFSEQAERLREEDADLVLWKPPVWPTAHQGAEAVSLRALHWTRDRAHDHPKAYEHVVAYAREHWRELNTIFVEHDPAYSGRFKFSIDTQEDLEFMRELYHRLYRPGQPVALLDAVELVRHDRELAAENEKLFRVAYG